MGEQSPRNDRLLMGMMVGPHQSGGGGPGSGSLSDGCTGLRSHRVERQDKVPPALYTPVSRVLPRTFSSALDNGYKTGLS